MRRERVGLIIYWDFDRDMIFNYALQVLYLSIKTNSDDTLPESTDREASGVEGGMIDRHRRALAGITTIARSILLSLPRWARNKRIWAIEMSPYYLSTRGFLITVFSSYTSIHLLLFRRRRVRFRNLGLEILGRKCYDLLVRFAPLPDNGFGVFFQDFWQVRGDFNLFGHEYAVCVG